MAKETVGPGAVNQYALLVREAGGLMTIHQLQHRDNLEIFKEVYFIVDKYFPGDEEEVSVGPRQASSR